MMDDERGDRKSALIIGIGSGDPSEKGDLPMLMRAFGRAMRHDDYDKAARIFEEAIAACDETAGDHDDDDNDKEDNPFYRKSRRSGHDDDDDDGLSF